MSLTGKDNKIIKELIDLSKKNSNLQNHLNSVLVLIGRTPQSSLNYAMSYELLANHLYLWAFNNNKTYKEALELAEPYFKKGCQSQSNKKCKESYTRALLSAAQKPNEIINEADIIEADRIEVSLGKALCDYESTLSYAEKQERSQKARLHNFIEKYKLNDLSYWHHQVKFGNGKTVVTIGGKREYTVPHGIADMYHIIHDDSKSTAEKLNDLASCKEKRSFPANFFFMFNRTQTTTECYEEAVNLRLTRQ